MKSVSKELDHEILRFLKDGNLTSSLEKRLREIISFNLADILGRQNVLKIFGNEKSAVDDVFQDVLSAFWEKRTEILKRNLDNLTGYLVKSVENKIYDYARSRKWKKTFSLDSKTDSESEESTFLEVFHTEEGAQRDPLERILAEKNFEELRNLFRNKEKDLCDFFYKKLFSDERADAFASRKTMQARYKSHERLAKRIRDFVVKNGITEEEFSMIVEIYVSEVCEKIR
ncbi:MAG: RNA polymerase, sigma-24 subunit, ECF subfamily [Thermotoga sp. 50_1627]|nr:MAG: RNA polymerase, sigma-24 subunit, ECF subfamily [Thermotoga sp. 50_64]KUK25283.1 MAG: RNA polymerase, sigma-24 subunit, ECF subfamily [Thermotoga sp. 50_1627]